MQKWPLWQNEFSVWRKKRQHLEEEACGFEREHRQFLPTNFRFRASGDEESLGTRATLGRRDTV
jgi:hypothetical protein